MKDLIETMDIMFSAAAMISEQHRLALLSIELNPFFIGPIIVGFVLILRWVNLRDRAGFVIFGIIFCELVYIGILLSCYFVVLRFGRADLVISFSLLITVTISVLAVGGIAWYFRIKSMG